MPSAEEQVTKKAEGVVTVQPPAPPAYDVKIEDLEEELAEQEAEEARLIARDEQNDDRVRTRARIVELTEQIAKYKPVAEK